jgi:hypothetical protein
MRALWMVVPVVLMGCAAMPAPEPQGAVLSESVLTVRLTDGTRCTADWRAAGGQGQMQGCAAPLSYQVAEVANPNLLRQLWVQLVDALGAEGLAPPMADVVLTDERGRTWRYVSPPPVE